MTLKYTILVPMNDEQDHVRELVHEVEAIMNTVGQPWEMICVDDGSVDDTLLRLKELLRCKPYLRVITLTDNFGQSAALASAIPKARGEYLITLDGDRQNDPADIPKLIAAAADADLVCGVRVDRQDPWLKRTASLLANTIRRRVCGDGVRDTGCSLKLFRTRCLQQLKLYDGMHRFFPALFVIEGFRVKEVSVTHRPRTSGQSKYPIFNYSLKPILDMWAVAWMRRRRLRYEVDRELP